MMMKRRSLVLTLACGVSALAALPAQAQTQRIFPPTALRGEFVLTEFPDALINRHPAKLAPGARIFGDTNLLMQPGSLVGQKNIVHYVIEPSSGLIMTVWILNPVELANKLWPRTPQEAATWTFDSASQTWKKP